MSLFSITSEFFALQKDPFFLKKKLFFPFLRNLFPSNLVAAAFRSVSITFLFLSTCVESQVVPRIDAVKPAAAAPHSSDVAVRTQRPEPHEAS